MQVLLNAVLVKGIFPVNVAHGGADIFPADIFHQHLDVPLVRVGPGGKAPPQRVAAVAIRLRQPSTLKQRSQQRHNAAGLKRHAGDATPAIDPPKDWALR